MEPVKMTASTTKKSNLDQILGTEEDLAPSSGFVASVMDRVREEAAAPEPIPFPWKRVLPGMVFAVAGLVWSVVKLVQIGLSDARAVSLVRLPHAVTSMRLFDGAGWVAAALGVSLLSWLLARRMIGRSEML